MRCSHAFRIAVSVACVLGTAGLSSAQSAAAAAVATTLQARPAIVGASGEVIVLPNRERVGLFGTAYLLALSPSLSFGPAIFGAITGARGGLFVLAANLQARRPVHGPFGVVGSLVVGGGGGGGAPVGEGLFLRPSTGLSFRAADITTTLSVAHTRLGGRIASTQATVGVQVPSTFRAVRRDHIDVPTTATTRSGMGFDAFDVAATTYWPSTPAPASAGTRQPTTIGLIGARAHRALTRRVELGVAGAGAFAGGVAGYAEYLADLSVRAALANERLSVGVRSAAGMAGGGGLAVGGGLLVKGAITGEWRWSEALALRGDAGYVTAPSGRFRALSSTVGASWTIDARPGNPTPERATRMEWLIGLESYGAPRTDGRRAAVQNLAFRLNRFITRRLYVTGQARSALGGGAGAYAVGLLGAGGEWPLHHPWRGGTETVLGAGGGGGVSTGSGAVAQVEAYASREITRDLAFRAGVGRVRSLRGGLNATVVDISAGYAFGVTRGRRPSQM